MSSLFSFFLCFWIFKSCNVVGCHPMQTLHILLLLQIFPLCFFRDITKLLPSMVWLKNTWHSSISWWPLETGYFALSLIILFPVSFMTWVWNLCFVDLSCCFNCFFSYWPTACYEKRGSLNSSTSSSMKFVRSVNCGYLIWTFLIFFTFIFYLASTLGFFSRSGRWHLVYLVDSDYHTPDFDTLLEG